MTLTALDGLDELVVRIVVLGYETEQDDDVVGWPLEPDMAVVVALPGATITSELPVARARSNRPSRSVVVRTWVACRVTRASAMGSPDVSSRTVPVTCPSAGKERTCTKRLHNRI